MTENKLTPTAIPFWSWNDELEEGKLVAQIRKMKERGYGGFFMHARSGLKTEYLSDKWFDCIRACCEEAKKLGMEAWAYDENGWPSGFVGGKLLETKEFRVHYLDSSIGDFDQNASFHYLIDGDQIKRQETSSAGKFVNVYEKESVSLADIMNGEVVDAFIRETHEKYKKEVPDIANNIVGFFTDEPLYTEHEQTPYTKILPAYYMERYGEDLFDKLGLLYFEGVGYEKFRYRYYKSCQELMLKNFAEKVYTWLDDNGLKLTGHYVEERTMWTQVLNNAGIMPYYEYLHMPGIDWLCRRYLFVSTIRQMTSVAEQLQKEKTLCEMFAMTGWDVTPKELKSIADYQYNYGVNVMCFHLLPYSERGERKNDYPAHFSSFNAWIDKGIAPFNRYFDYLGDFIRKGKENVNVAVLFTVRSIYVKYNCKDWGDSCEPLDESYIIDGCATLANNHVAFHILDETLLAKYGSVKDGRITLGACSYDTLVIPKAIVIDKFTDDILRQFVAQGGKVHLLGDKPYLVDGDPANFDYLQNNVSYQQIFDANEYVITSKSKELHTSLRTIDGVKYVFIVNIGDTDVETQVIVDGNPLNATYDVVNGTVSYVGDNIVIPKKESLIVTKFCGEIPSIKDYETVEIGTNEYEIVDFNANYLALDFACISYDGVNYEDKLPVVGIFRRLLEERYCGKVYLKYNFTVKEQLEYVTILAEDSDKIKATLNGEPITFDGDSALDEIYKVADVNGKVIVGENQLIVEYDFYQDENVYYALFGEGVSESLRNCMTYNTMITAPYVAGKFGVYSNDFRAGSTDSTLYADSFYLASSPKKVTSLVEQGFAFFAGNVTLKTTFTANSENVKLKLNGRFHIAEVTVNGNFAGTLIFSDVIDVSAFAKMGENTLEIKLYSGNRNLLGPHHLNTGDLDTEVGPYAFDFTDTWKGNDSPVFAKRYCFSKFGLFDK